MVRFMVSKPREDNAHFSTFLLQKTFRVWKAFCKKGKQTWELLYRIRTFSQICFNKWKSRTFKPVTYFQKKARLWKLFYISLRRY